MYYALTFFGVLLEAVTVALLQFFGETETSDSVFKFITFISVILILSGVKRTFKENNGKELAKALLIQFAIIAAGFAIVWLLTWSLIIGFGAIVLTIAFIYFYITTL